MEELTFKNLRVETKSYSVLELVNQVNQVNLFSCCEEPIELMLLRVPLPNIFIDATGSEFKPFGSTLLLASVINFVSDVFPLRRLRVLKEYENKMYSDLSRPDQRKIMETKLNTYIIEDPTCDRWKRRLLYLWGKNFSDWIYPGCETSLFSEDNIE